MTFQDHFKGIPDLCMQTQMKTDPPLDEKGKVTQGWSTHFWDMLKTRRPQWFARRIPNAFFVNHAIDWPRFQTALLSHSLRWWRWRWWWGGHVKTLWCTARFEFLSGNNVVISPWRIQCCITAGLTRGFVFLAREREEQNFCCSANVQLKDGMHLHLEAIWIISHFESFKNKGRKKKWRRIRNKERHSPRVFWVR